jgi:hypothetical protein
MSRLDELEELIKKLDLKFVRADDSILLPFSSKIGRVIIEAGFVLEEGWLALRAPIQVEVPDSPEEKAILFEKALAFNAHLAAAKVLFTNGGLHVGYEIDADKLSKEVLEEGIGFTLIGAEIVQTKITKEPEKG